MSLVEQWPGHQVSERRDAFTAMVRRHDGRLRGLASRLLAADRSRVDDALQEAYVRAYRALPDFRGEAELGSWLYRITYNACIDELRRTRRRPPPVDTAAPGWDRPGSAAGPEPEVAAADAVTRAVAALPDDQRVTVVMVDGEGFDNITAARILGVAPGTIASRLSRARAAMRHALGEEER